jgi:signal transduction histidine kinase
MSWLVAALLFRALPAVVPAGVDTGTLVTTIGKWLSPAVFLVMLLVPDRGEADGQPEVVDFVYSVIVVLLLSVLVLGSLALILLLHHAYVEALLESLLVIGAMLLILGWIWNPHVGIAGIGTVFSRYLLSIGLPVEQWLHSVADLAHRQEDPGQFVAEACRDMVRQLPWVTGVEWESDLERGRFGLARGRRSEFRFGGLAMAIHTRYPLSPSLAWHFRLLAQVIAEFYGDKKRARELKRLSYVQAIHETGARLTHDVKNLLQTLRTLCSAADGQAGDISPEFVALLRRQLPAITERLGQTLDKLQVPSLDGDQPLPLVRWWEDLRQRYASAPVRFDCPDVCPADDPVPAALFNHVTENLLANALRKRATTKALQIVVSLRRGKAGAELEVADDGEAIPSALTPDLLHGPVRSEQGMGIGLYQAARLAQQGGYELALVANQPGHVCFRLSPAAAPVAAIS